MHETLDTTYQTGAAPERSAAPDDEDGLVWGDGEAEQ